MVLLSMYKKKHSFLVYLSVFKCEVPCKFIWLYKYIVNNKIGFWYTKKSHCTSSIERFWQILVIWFNLRYRWTWKEKQIHDINDVNTCSCRRAVLSKFPSGSLFIVTNKVLPNENIWSRFTPEQYYMSESTRDGKRKCWIYYNKI